MPAYAKKRMSWVHRMLIAAGALASLAGLPVVASATWYCSDSCGTVKTDYLICSTCCRGCVDANGNVVYEYCNTVCIDLRP